MRKQIYTVVGYMLNRWKIWLTVKIWVLRYYIQNPDMYWKKIKLRNSIMIDNEHDEIDVPKVINWVGLVTLGGLWWYSLFTNGLGVTIVWTVVVVALMALWFTMRDNRL